MAITGISTPAFWLGLGDLLYGAVLTETVCTARNVVHG